ncbi:hypothetical protein [Vitiosangium sp. GDMCC 1.1324]|uniref:hypothetical protein n=1 Tax=Vitiosangium sp. (strain GDMCC 1.1324) TaxID=2138576 RepID=UPI000D39E170|nr:hypothetical protein [Vitiosangium sp. GDMCC 1.1324]PTL77280.1 hypothetical protein DAT35_45440 [Vitiosangium sp. GDMCC 1.1324]
MTAAPFCTFDDSLWPLLILRMTREPSNQELEEYLDRSASFLRRGERHVVIADLLQGGMITAEQRRRQADWMLQHDRLLRETVLGNAFVMTSPILRLGLNILFYIRMPPCPYVVVSRLEPALVWAADRLEGAGLHEASERVRRHWGLLPTRNRFS